MGRALQPRNPLAATLDLRTTANKIPGCDPGTETQLNEQNEFCTISQSTRKPTINTGCHFAIPGGTTA
jgi:hypothetical protein